MDSSKGKKNLKNCLTIGNVTYKTSGNILFFDNEEDRYYLAESPLLNKADEAIRAGILENGMQTLFKMLR